MPKKIVRTEEVHRIVHTLFENEMHAKRIESLANGVTGVMHSGSLVVRLIGQGLAHAHELKTKHAVKQVDRLVGNEKLVPWELASTWVPFVCGDRDEIVVALDWTDFDHDGHSTLAANLVNAAGHGRTLPLIWKTVEKSKLKHHRNEFEDEVLQRLKETLPASVKKVTILADRGFGDSKLYEALKEEWGFDFVIRFRGDISVTDTAGVTKTANEWLSPRGVARKLTNVTVTNKNVPLAAVVVVKGKGMKQAWHLAVGDATKTASEAVALYARRFTIEETFRDIKDIRFGMGLSSTKVSSPIRRDRLLLLSALTVVLLTMLGEAGESIGLDMDFKANTSKKRTHSLLRQGSMYYEFLSAMPEDKVKRLIEAFIEKLRKQPALAFIFQEK